jgi:exodeoxyribonuclease-5
MTTLDFDPSPDQQAALNAILEWRDTNPRGDKQYLTLGGYAGTGKSTLVAHLAKTWVDVAVVALCGKAAHVLRTKGVPAQTIHSLIYAPIKIGGRVRYQRR